jgi:hypothetical protein
MTSRDLKKQARKYIFDYFLENCRAPVLEEIMSRFRVDRETGHQLLRALESSHHIALLPGTQRILMANPFSGITTPFRDSVGDKTYFANCAWDTISLHVMVGQDTEVEAFCHHCAEPIRIKLSRGRVVASEPEDPVIFLSIPVAKWYDNLINTCSNNMVYFRSREHRDGWLRIHPELKGETLTVEKMAEACQPLSKDRMKMDYVRPSPNQLMSHWQSIGLRSDYWKI